MQRTIKIFICFLMLLSVIIDQSQAAVRLKDIARVRDQKTIQLIGYGLIVGLNGTGDGKNTQFTIYSIGNMMKSMGIEVSADKIKVKNTAAVMVTANVSPYTKVGDPFDVTVSSLGDAKSLQGGTLILSPLSGLDGIMVAKAQGQVSVGGTNKNFGGQGGVVRNDDLVGIVANGGILEKELPTLSMNERNIAVTLLNPDYTTAYRLSTAINGHFRTNIATAKDAGSVIIDIPTSYSSQNDIVKFISEVELVSFEPDEKAKVVINERTGTIVAGSNVSLGSVAIMHGTLSITIGAGNQQQAQAQAAQGASQNNERIVSLQESSNVGDVAKALNMMGVTPRDMIAIFQALKQSGSLRAELLII